MNPPSLIIIPNLPNIIPNFPKIIPNLSKNYPNFAKNYPLFVKNYPLPAKNYPKLDKDCHKLDKNDHKLDKSKAVLLWRQLLNYKIRPRVDWAIANCVLFTLTIVCGLHLQLCEACPFFNSCLIFAILIPFHTFWPIFEKATSVEVFTCMRLIKGP